MLWSSSIPESSLHTGMDALLNQKPLDWSFPVAQLQRRQGFCIIVSFVHEEIIIKQKKILASLEISIRLCHKKEAEC